MLSSCLIVIGRACHHLPKTHFIAIDYGWPIVYLISDGANELPTSLANNTGRYPQGLKDAGLRIASASARIFPAWRVSLGSNTCLPMSTSPIDQASEQSVRRAAMCPAPVVCNFCDRRNSNSGIGRIRGFGMWIARRTGNHLTLLSFYWQFEKFQSSLPGFAINIQVAAPSSVMPASTRSNDVTNPVRSHP